jgi:hypothetical protein
MINEEYRAIKIALVGWFNSQSVDATDAAVAMGALIAEIAAQISESESDMEEGIRAFVRGFEDAAEKIKRDKYDRVRR